MFYTNQPVKLADCRLHDSSSELFLVEGDSAALAVTKMRSAQTQAVLPMQGKPMNTLTISEKKLLESPLFKALIDALGAGVGEHFELQKMRYGKIILLMDADADGIHCGALMLMFFYRWMRPLLENELVELVRPPVGEVTNTETGKVQFAYTDADFMHLCGQEKAEQNQLNSIKYRGLAGMPPHILARVCIEHETRKTSVMRTKDAEMAIAVFGGNIN